MEIILFAPPSWNPVVIYDKYKMSSLLAQGYRRDNPKAVEQSPVVVTEETIEPTAIPSNTEGLLINHCSLADLVALPGVGTATGKRIIANRPYRVAEDLFEISDRIDWLSIKIDYT